MQEPSRSGSASIFFLVNFHFCVFRDRRRRTHGALFWFTQGTEVKRVVQVKWSVLDGHTEEEYINIFVGFDALSGVRGAR
jgi:hypothetical protein